MILVNRAVSTASLDNVAWFSRIRTMNRKIHSTVSSSSQPNSVRIQRPRSEVDSNPGLPLSLSLLPENFVDCCYENLFVFFLVSGPANGASETLVYTRKKRLKQEALEKDSVKFPSFF